MKKINIVLAGMLLGANFVSPVTSFANSLDNEETSAETAVNPELPDPNIELNNEEAVAEPSVDATESSATETTQEEEGTVEVTADPESSTEEQAETKEVSRIARAATDSVTIVDPNLKTVILTTLGMVAGSDLTEADMARLTSLYLPNNSANAQINSFSGLEYAVNLQDINMSTNLVTDFSPLEQLTNLKYVRLQGTNVTSDNFPDLRKSTTLNLISLTNSSVDDRVMSKLTPLASLDSISFESNMNITTIAPLKVLPNLTSLRVQFCAITDFTVVKEFPALISLAATGQNTGRNDPATTVNSTKLGYDAGAKTLFIPFSMMPNRMTNFDGYVPPFTTSNSASQTYFDFNGVQLLPERLQITEEGITVLGVSQEEFEGLATFEYNARINNPAGSYAQPEGYTFYAISSGTYLHQFNVVHGPEEGAPVTVKHVDESGNELASSDELVGAIGYPYETTAKEIVGWAVKEIPLNATGTYTDQAQDVVYVYEKKSAILSGAPVTVKYIDESGNELAETDQLTGNVGETYRTAAKEITGWVVEKVPTNATGLFTEETQEVVYEYKKVNGDKKTTPSSNKQTAIPNQQNLSNTDGTNKQTDQSKQKLPKTGENAELQNSLTLAGLQVMFTISVFTFMKKKKPEDSL